MEKTITVERGKQIILPYHEDMDLIMSCEGNDPYDIQSLKNNYTDNYAQCIRITKKLNQNSLVIRSFKKSIENINITYKNNGKKDILKINDEDIEINTDDTIITLTIDEDIRTLVHIISNDILVNETIINEETEKNNQATITNQSLQEQYKELLEKNNQLIKDNQQLQTKIETLNIDSQTLDHQNKQLAEDIEELDHMFKENQDSHQQLQDEFNAALNHYNITQDIFNEYKDEDKSKEIVQQLDNIKNELNQVEDMLKKYIILRQKKIQSIREKVKPQ